MGRSSISRNAPCPCGSGRKYKHCCLADEQRARREAQLDDVVGRRIQRARAIDDADIQVFATWFHNDRELAAGGTPAERYAARADLPAAEREAASRIAAAQLGLYRVLAVEPGRSLRLEELVGGTRVGVRSPHVSQEAVRWDILLARVMGGDPPTLWGPTRFFEPCEEPELLAELARLAGSPLDELDEQALALAFRRHALELMRFVPPSRSAEPSFYTLEGDPIVLASATWKVHDIAGVAERMRDLGGLEADDPLEVDITAPRATLVAQRPPLPPGALVLEASPVDAIDTIPIAALRLQGAKLHAEAMSERRLDETIEIVADDFRELVELESREATSVDEALAARGAERHDPTPDRVDATELLLAGHYVNERMRRWLDEPHQLLGGRTPREAASCTDRAEVVRLLRQIENGAERARRCGEPAVDVARLRTELGLSDELAA